MKTNRRTFLKNLSALTLISGGGVLTKLYATDYNTYAKSKLRLRVIFGSDIHYGQPKTDFDLMTDTFVTKVNSFNLTKETDFCILNGDLIHNKPEFMPQVKFKADKLDIPYFPVRGNHDMVSPEAWEEVWGKPLNYSFIKNRIGFILADTSNEKGTYLSPDLDWLKSELDQMKSLKTVILVLHIPQAKWTANGIENTAFFDLLKEHPNVKAVFHGHEHDQDGIIRHEGKPYIFDSHIGGSWGTDYRGFRVLEIYKNGDLLTYMMNPDVAGKTEKI